MRASRTNLFLIAVSSLFVGIFVGFLAPFPRPGGGGPSCGAGAAGPAAASPASPLSALLAAPGSPARHQLDRVVIYGYVQGHTHSFIHASWVKAFKHAGYDAHWYSDQSPPPAGFSFRNALVITEGFADGKLPLEPTSVYLVHVLPEAGRAKYHAAGARLVDLRYNNYFQRDHVYDYDLRAIRREGRLTDLSDASCYEAKPLADGTVAFYTFWATDLLPDEFDEAAVDAPTEDVSIFVGTVSASNVDNFRRLTDGCRQLGVRVQHIDPWAHPVDFEENRKLVRKSVIAPDIRGSGDPAKVAKNDFGTSHKENGYVACRLFKNISYGKLGGTNSKRMADLFPPGLVIYNDDEAELAKQCHARRMDKDLVLKQMRFVKEKHTYLNRIDDVLRVRPFPHPTAAACQRLPGCQSRRS